jgi:hypothetical protein
LYPCVCVHWVCFFVLYGHKVHISSFFKVIRFIFFHSLRSIGSYFFIL